MRHRRYFQRRTGPGFLHPSAPEDGRSAGAPRPGRGARPVLSRERRRTGVTPARTIIDLTTGAQPIANEDESILLVCNGEIYNHRELRAGLESRGHRFRTRTDVEVALHLYEDLGEGCLDPLNGMFGIAILDLRQGRLLLARDRAGMKPLYTASTAQGFLFASEPRALLSSGLVEPSPDWAGIDTYLAVGYTPAPRTCYRGIEKLPAGHYLVIDRNGVRRQSYWKLRYRSDGPRRPDSEYAGELRQLLDAAVRTHLDADVELGAWVSGGWDSSLVAALAARQASRPLKTFSIVFPDHPDVDEGRYARALTASIGSDHHEIEFRAEDVPRLFSTAVCRLGEPCLASPCLLLYALSSLAAQSVKAVVSGEGSDELFAGYEWLQHDADVYYRLRRVVPPWLCLLPAVRATDLRWRRLWRVLAAPDTLAADAEWYRVFAPREIDSIISPEVRNGRPDVSPLRLDPETLDSCRDPLERRLALEFTRRLPEGILMVADRMSMAHSLELRMPFLDATILEFSAALPPDMRRRGSQEKYILSFMRDLLPPEVSSRKKFGLLAPMRQYLTGSLRNFLFDLLLDPGALGGSLDRKALERWLRRWLARPDPYLRRPWSLAILAGWWNSCLRR